MAARIRRWARQNAWVLFADLIGLASLESLLATAGTAAALKPALFVLIMMVPVTGLIVMMVPQPKRLSRPAQPAVRPRTVYISPRPCDQRR
jgi:hypothetical protein